MGWLSELFFPAIILISLMGLKLYMGGYVGGAVGVGDTQPAECWCYFSLSVCFSGNAPISAM
ncbi:hypothetical protein B9Q04_14850 [Candidatus Marsarchaeota G2 archaeon BE_D]|jgi:hypothetical protein|uniref:Uncharacterized protein n=1 Tax=Candidatus Marsarchaeota G2 archaeon BE_D TaxID=1978158 RepID=A0A2R6C6Y8_9ARCH|nr:MAG: hypothetical protein B9Q04_14850 [Candidatus Marsarchaeota G2 archaeon BE_D]